MDKKTSLDCLCLSEWIGQARMEVAGRKKKLSVGDAELMEMIVRRVEEGGGSLSEADEADRNYLRKVVRETVWGCANAEEADLIIGRLKSNDEAFACQFFYGTDCNGCNIARFRSKLINMIRQVYQVEISVREFGNILYVYLWDNNTWSVLDKYSCKGGFFAWLEQVAQHAVFAYLEEMGYVRVVPERTAGNTRIWKKSLTAAAWMLIVSELMPAGIHRDVLLATLAVGQEDEEKKKDPFDLTAEELARIKREAETKLRDRIICGACCYEELALHDRLARRVFVSAEIFGDGLGWKAETQEHRLLSDVFGIGLSDAELHDRVLDFLYTFSERMEWTDADRLLWRLRFIDNMAPVEVAVLFGRKRSWVDGRFSRLNACFGKAVRAWWNDHAEGFWKGGAYVA